MPVMDSEAVADVCANCGAPLEVDDASKCVWCHATLRVASPKVVIDPVARARAIEAEQASLVPRGMWDVGDWENIYVIGIVSSLVELSSHDAIQEYTRRQPELHHQIRELSTAVKQTGARVKDQLRDDFDFKLYTPEDIWMFDLGYDVVAMLESADTTPREEAKSRRSRSACG